MPVVHMKRDLEILNGCMFCQKKCRYKVGTTVRSNKEQANDKPFSCNSTDK